MLLRLNRTFLCRVAQVSAQCYERVPPRRYRSSAGTASDIGLFGMAGVRQSDDFAAVAATAIERMDTIRAALQRLQAQDSPDPQVLLPLLDAISNELCIVTDAAELCRNVHSDDAFKRASNEIFQLMSGYIHKLNADTSLYNACMHLINDDAVYGSLTDEDQLFLHDLRQEFEVDGIHLRGAEQERVLQLHGAHVEAQSAFMQNINENNVQSSTELIIGPFKDVDNLRQLKPWAAQLVPQRHFTQGELYLTCSSHRSMVGALMPSLREEELRQQLYVAAYHQPHDNINACGRLLQSRQALAIALGYRSHAHKVLNRMILGTPAAVEEMLTELSTASKKSTEQELQVMAKLKAALAKDSAKEARNEGLLSNLFSNRRTEQHAQAAPLEVFPWDTAHLSFAAEYFQGQEMEGTQRAAAKVREYFSLETCVQGLQLISERLFGITFREQPFAPHEGWTNGNSGDVVRKYIVYDSAEQMLGTVYMDLYPRENKFPGNAHFTVQCGCLAVHDIKELGKENIELNLNNQLPIIALVFNLHRQHQQEQNEPLLSLHEVETLHHEWGHALHSLLSRTKYQHLSGTRGRTDLIEVPSHWMEYFARDARVVSQWARHHITGERIPLQLLETALKYRQRFPAIEMQTQLLYSAADQFLHGERMGDITQLSPESVYYRAVEGVVEMQEQYTVLPLGLPPQAANTRYALKHHAEQPSRDRTELRLPSISLLAHGHLDNYGGSYYAYLFAKMYAAQIWYHHFHEDPLNSSAGQFLNDNLLSRGSSVPAANMLATVSGSRFLDPNHYLRTIGL